MESDTKTIPRRAFRESLRQPKKDIAEKALSSERNEAGAGEGNRTLVSSLGSYSSTIELHPRRAWMVIQQRR